MNAQWKKGRNDGPMGMGWKVICALLYFFPLQEIGAYGHTFIEKFPIYAWIDQLTVPFEYFFSCHEFAPLIWFFGLYLGVVKNRRFPHVARYHVMLGTMIDIIGMILSILRENLPFSLSWGPYYWWFISFMFWGVFFLIFYCMVFALKGWYVDIPMLSDATYLQVEQAEMMDKDALEGGGMM